MKKTSLLVAFAISGGVLFGQSQRLVLIEEYTQASCPPCASYNPGFNTLLKANTTKVTSVKYQVSWPGTDPMYNQNKTECKTRWTYYGVNGVPCTYTDGKSSSPSQTNINTEYAVPSPFTMQLDYHFNTNNDSVFINCVVTCSQAVTLTTPKLQVTMVEKTITFSSAPGGNGEKTFYNVMRKMYPDGSGTTLPTAWTVGQTQTFTFKALIPTYIYKKTEIAMVAWIQDDSGKNIKQAAFAATPSTNTNVADVVSTNSLNIFPNPSTGVFTANFKTEKSDNYTLKITNVLGQVVYQEAINNFSGTYSKQMDVTSYGKGAYTLSITNSKNEDVKEVVVY